MKLLPEITQTRIDNIIIASLNNCMLYPRVSKTELVIRFIDLVSYLSKKENVNYFDDDSILKHDPSERILTAKINEG